MESALVEFGGIATTPEQRINEMVAEQHLLDMAIKKLMVEGVHFGKIPGVDKPSLHNVGADVLSRTFGLVPTFPKVDRRDLADGHVEYIVVCELLAKGTLVGAGVGSCSTLESKYRYRNIADYEITGDKIPDDAKAKKQEYRKAGFGMKQVNGVWEWVKYKDSSRQENPDIADIYNTVLKMAKKRAYVDAVITRTAASNVFTQDLEDTVPEDVPPEQPPRKPEPKQKGTHPQVQAWIARAEKDIHDFHDSLPDLQRCRSKWAGVSGQMSEEDWSITDGKFKAAIQSHGIDPDTGEVLAEQPELIGGKKR